MRPARVVFERGLRLMKRWLLDWVVSLLVEQHLESTTTTTAAVPSLVEFHEFRVASNWMGEKERKRERERMAGAFAGCTAVVLVGCLLLKERKRGWRPPRCKSVFTFSMRRPPDPHSPLSYPPASSYCSCRFSSEGEGEKSKKEKLEGDATGQNTEKTDGRISK